MEFRSTQKIIFDILERDGAINNLGLTYSKLTDCPKMLCTESIDRFIQKVKEIYPEAKLKNDNSNNLDTSTLYIK